MALLKFALIALLGGLCVLSACNTVAPSKPTVVITAPASESQFRENDAVEIEIIADDARAVKRIEFLIDGNLIGAETAPADGDRPTFVVLFLWQATPGKHTFVARTFNTIEQFAQSSPVVVHVVPAVAQAIPTDTPSVAPSPTIPSTRSSSSVTAVFAPSPTALAVAPATTVPAVIACNGAPSISTFTVTTERITVGGSTTIQWGLVTNASSVEIDQGIGRVATPGSRMVSPATTTTYTLTARCGANAQIAQVTIFVNPAGSAIGNFAGSWTHNFGALSIAQAGTIVLNTSTYTNAFSGSATPGSLGGTVTSNTLNGTWSIAGASGTFQFYLGVDGNTFDGAWQGSPPQQQNRWCGARPGASFPAGCSFAGIWSITLAANPSCASLSLARVDDTVTGNLCGSPLSGTLQYGGSETVLNGTSAMGGAVQPFVLYLLGYNATQFQGKWNNASDFCGWRGGASPPSPCGR